jgi:hypothetical protein
MGPPALEADHPHMARRLTALATAAVIGALLAVPATAPAKGGLASTLAADKCSAEKKKLGKKRFQKKYGKKGVANCLKRTRGEANRAVAVATTECQVELDEYGLEDFLLDWSSFEECVATYAQWEMDGGLVEDDEEGWEEE